ncbi:RNase H family protein [Glutamicibacter sp. MCAF14]|uniref:RNase H family protein n=1 Tax=Glutamicibacter sp. MCAF14 TaxID=3233043 RepID=UPI003F8DC972
MLVSVPRPQMPIALEPDGVRRLAGAQRQPQPSRLIAVLERSAFIRDAHGKKQQYVPFAERIVEEKHLAQRSTHGLHFDFALTLCDFVNRPLLTLTGTAANGELDQAILQAIAEFSVTSKISQPSSIDLLVPDYDDLGMAELSMNPIFCLNPSWQFGLDLGVANQANSQALAPLVQDYTAKPSVIAYTDGSVPRNRKFRSAGAMVTSQGHWACAISPKHYVQDTLLAETTGALLALTHAPLDSDLTIFSDSRALVKAVNDLVQGRQRTVKVHHELRESLELRTGRTRARWVRGHDGNRHNEAANRMAILMSRHFSARINPQLTQSMMTKIVLEELSQQALAA